MPGCTLRVIPVEVNTEKIKPEADPESGKLRE
jgi:hypothetical protein